MSWLALCASAAKRSTCWFSVTFRDHLHSILRGVFARGSLLSLASFVKHRAIPMPMLAIQEGGCYTTFEWWVLNQAEWWDFSPPPIHPPAKLRRQRIVQFIGVTRQPPNDHIGFLRVQPGQQPLVVEINHILVHAERRVG